MPTLSSSGAAHLLTKPFRRHKQRYEINPPDETHSVVYLGNVLTIMAKGDQSVERPLGAIWRSYSTRKRDVPMKLTVTRSGLKVETKQLGVTEYWAHRITYCYAPPEYPRVFCWVYKHEGKRMKPELRCHAVLCKKHAEPARLVETLTNYLQMALQEYKREKLTMEKARKNSVTSGGCPRRKLILQTGTLNFRPPVNRSKSAPRLGSIDEEDEQDDEERMMDEGTSMSDFEYDEMSDLESRRGRLASMRQAAQDLSDGSESDSNPPEAAESTVSQLRRMFATNVQVTAL
ncbi:PID domain-containing protein [Aphelenchoides fujianensis]|nr:PID domain-containing protein [Aphelenchoides fujianensis]